MLPLNRQSVSSEGKQRIESRLMADSSSKSDGDQFLGDGINWSDRPREIVDYAASRCKLPVESPILSPRRQTPNQYPFFRGVLGANS